LNSFRFYIRGIKFWIILLCLVFYAERPINATSQDRLVIVSPHWEGIKYEFAKGFNDYYFSETGRLAKIEWMDVGGTSEIIRFIKSEFTRTPSSIGIDIMFGGGSDPFIELNHMNLLEPYKLPSELLVKLPKEVGGYPIYDPEYRWYGATMAGFGIIYNKKVVEMVKLALPKTWEDLTKPSLFSWVGAADPRKSGSAHMPFEIILQVYGWEKGWQIITALGANSRGFSNSGSQVPKDVTSGEVAYGMVIDFYAWAQINAVGRDLIGYTMPDNLTILNPDGISILKGAPNKLVAQAFLRYLFSESGQRLWMQIPGSRGGPEKYHLNRFTVLPHLYDQIDPDLTSVTFNPFNWESTFVYNAEVGTARRLIVDDLIGVFLIDTHAALQKRWLHAIQEGNLEQILPTLSSMPITEEESLILSSSWRDQAFRNRTLLSWNKIASEKYKMKTNIWRSPRLLIFSGSGFFLVGIVAYLWRLKKRNR